MIPPPALPPPVRPGDRIGVAALSGPVDPERLEAGLEALRGLGYEPVEAENLRASAGIFAGSDDERLGGFHRLAADPEVRAILFARGGYGALRVLPRIDWELLAGHPRAYVGYSDVTPFLLQVVARLGLVAFHGPMVAADLARGLTDGECLSLSSALAGRCETEIPLRFAARSSAAGAEGPLVGGCLSLLVSTLGTPYAPDLEGAILFFEDVNEPFYRVDRMLTHLRLSGSLDRLHGVVAGHLTGDSPEGSESGSGADAKSVHGRLRELGEAHGWPVAWGLQAGHSCPNLTLPLGSWARLEPARCSLVFGLPRASPNLE